ncbi:hypothetical protein METBIDRAFT_84747 [Metschnikowia bicuspidata var. bicuspidata NRRL YB-4993]|uniref:Uncharacterized protein n=1 Tax=Metschnikowia bicuspidata var. bicuspidata NRRL YB-4993 TaxID=869754 RepID=A0A1A0H4I4_9ASCO|nr:hypothetical protein METBIDRAFT_84747 [Metschnikowia bicuspidata var. bicuspidata NRRL YB-4993]OBA18951.1 hypothetical protein METBIDRAFT_84747 [Metschnikowia bicuspidata var. bicuspidata NRRL YB-4993]
MHCDHHIFGLFATHWHELTKKHKKPGALNKTADLDTIKEGGESEGFDSILWSKCFKICEKTHGESLPCFSMADFNTFLTSHTQNFVEKDCGALKLYNDLFGKQNLKDILFKKNEESSTVGKRFVIKLDLLISGSSELGAFLDEAFIIRASHRVALFLEEEFQNPLNPVFCITFRKREAYNAIKYYINDVNYSCLSIPTLLRKIKTTLEIVEELKAQIHTEGSSIVIQDLRDEVSEAVKNSQNIQRSVTQVIHAIDSGSDLLRTLSAWANYECSLTEVYESLKARHDMFMATVPFDRIQKIKYLCDYLTTASKKIFETVKEIEENLSDSISLSLSLDTHSFAANSKEKFLVVDHSNGSER